MMIWNFGRVIVYGGRPGTIRRGLISGQIIPHKICPQMDVSQGATVSVHYAELEGAYMENPCAISMPSLELLLNF